MLYKDDVALVEKAVTLGFRDQDSCNAWERIKKFIEVHAAQSGEAPVQQLKAEIAEVRKYIENMRSSKMSAESILNHVDGTLRQLSAV